MINKLYLHLIAVSILFSFSPTLEAKILPAICQETNFLAQRSHFGTPRGPEADRLVVDKGRRLLHVMKSGQILRSFRVALGTNPLGPKKRAGDGKTPEGSYFIESRNSASDFHLALKISYPDQEDINEARERGYEPGDFIMVHGLPNEAWKRPFLRHPKDWTKGCVAVTNAEIESIWSLVKSGTPIDLCP